MPSAKPRVNVVLEPEIFDLVRRIGGRTGKSASKVLREIIEPSEPVLRQIADTLDRLAGLEGNQLRSAAIEAAQALSETGNAMASDLHRQMSIFEVQGVGREDHEDAPAGAPAETAASAALTPACNAGVTLAESAPKPPLSKAKKASQK